ncbi:MAG: class C beta-lactamase-related serine hydrolase, partial [Actinobacteria bacterium]|nr:class C beta-lactamase-related serine hydrolase [Actinomycetota bacterium]
MTYPRESWATGTLSSSVDELVVESEISSQFADGTQYGTTLAMVVVHAGQVVAERYDESVGPTTKLISWSMAKSITDALVGMCVDGGLLSVGDPAPVAAWRTDERSAITLQHLLEMRSGLRWVEDYVDGESSDVIAMLFGAGKEDHARYAIDCPL